MVGFSLSYLRRLLRWLAGVPEVLLEEMPDCPANFLSYRRYLETGHQRVPGGWIFEGAFYPDYLTVGGNSLAIQRAALRYCKGQGLDIGASHWPLPGSLPIDIASGPGARNNLDDVPDDSQDYVFSSHCLEHIADWRSALRSWVRKLKTNGFLFLYLPHPACKLWHFSNPMMKNEHAWAPDPLTVRREFESAGLRIVEADDGPDHFYSFFVCAQVQRR
jgi:SAM-dependent methyltransferase